MTAEPTTPTRTRRGRWILLRWVLSLGLFALVAVAVRDRWQDVEAAGGLPGILPVAVAVVVNLLANLVLVHAWRVQLAVAGGRLPLRVAVPVWSQSQLSRLLFPGATFGARALLARRHGVAVTVGAVTTVLELVWMLTILPLLVLLTLPWWSQTAQGWEWLGWAAIAPLAVMTAMVLAPASSARGVARVLRRVPGLRRGVPSDDRLVAADLSRRDAVQLTGLYLANNVLREVAFVAVLAGLVDLDVTLVLTAVGASAVGRFVGMLAIFAPGGIGPREGVTALLLAPVIGGGPALVLVAAARLAEIVGEALLWGAGRVLGED